jgi:hypothetical protein
MSTPLQQVIGTDLLCSSFGVWFLYRLTGYNYADISKWQQSQYVTEFSIGGVKYSANNIALDESSFNLLPSEPYLKIDNQ